MHKLESKISNEQLLQHKVMQHAAPIHDNRPQSALQQKQIAGMNTGQPVQRKIMLKNKTVLDAKTVAEADGAPVKTMKEAAGNYLMQTAADVDKVNSGEDEQVSILTPDRHVIGETHNESLFSQAVNDWGWGAKKMIEALSENAMMPHIAGDTARKDANRLEHGALPLEDTMVKNLATCLAVKNPLNELLNFSRGDIDKQDEDKEKREKDINLMLKTAVDDSEAVLNIIQDLQGYYDASPGGFVRAFTSAVKRPQVDEIEKFLKTNPYAKLSPMYEMLEGQYKKKKNNVTERELTAGIACIDQLVTIYRELIRLNQNALYTQHNVGAATQFDEMGGAREAHMAAKIGNLPVPGLVKIGSNHIAGLGAYGIPGVRFYNHYFDFSFDTEAEKVKARL